MGSAPPAVYSVARKPVASGNSAAARATPAGAPGYGVRAVHVKVDGLNDGGGRMWITALSETPPAVATVSDVLPAMAESGTAVAIVNDVQSESATVTSTVPPPMRGNRTFPGAVPNPKPSITKRSPRAMIGSMAPSM